MNVKNLLLIYFFYKFFKFAKAEAPEGPKNTCQNLVDYLVMAISPNCWYNPDVGATPDEIANRYGYPFESYQVQTEDGYLLRIMRVPRKQGHPVYLQHGITGSIESWLMLGNQSLAFKLYEAGFDVWLGNFRGTYYSNEHCNKTITQEKYWDFSFHEMGYYDLPTMLGFIKAQTNRKIIYIGHSMGTTASYVYTILRKRHAEEHLEALISLAPVAFMRHFDLISSKVASLIPILKPLADMIQLYSIGVHNNNDKLNYISTCLTYPKSAACIVLVSFMLSLQSSSIRPEALSQFISKSNSGASVKTFEHYGQEIQNNGQFQFYDYGPRNKEIYGQKEPPIYNVSEIHLPVYLLYGTADTLTNKKDVSELYDQLNKPKYMAPVPEDDGPGFTHYDFVVGKDIQKLYTALFEVLFGLVHDKVFYLELNDF